LKHYQAVLILNPDLEEKAVKDFQDNFQKLLKKGKAKNISELESNLRDLAHAIKKHPRTHFWRVGFEADPGLIVKLREEIRHDERLLRQMYLDIGAEKEAESQEKPTPPEEEKEKAVEKPEEAKKETTEEPSEEIPQETAEETKTAEETAEETAEDTTEESAEETTEESVEKSEEKTAEDTPQEAPPEE